MDKLPSLKGFLSDLVLELSMTRSHFLFFDVSGSVKSALIGRAGGKVTSILCRAGTQSVNLLFYQMLCTKFAGLT